MTNFTNKEISKLLRDVAAAYTVKNEKKYKFQIVAYQRAADSIEHLSSEIKDLWDEGKIDQVPGVGKSLASYLDELFKSGKVKHFENIVKGLPQAMFEFLKVPGIGPKTAFKLAKYLGIKDKENALERLNQVLKKKEVININGFGQIMRDKILKGIEELSRKTERILLPIADKIAQDIIDYLYHCPDVVRVDPLGSLRRRCSTIGDIDISVASPKPQRVVSYFVAYPKKKRILEAGTTSASILHRSGFQVDLMVQPPRSYGALLQHFTGSKHHNIRLREYALKKGFSLSEYGIRKVRKGEGLEVGAERNKKPSKKLIEFETEEKFYNFLGLSWIPPELREDTGEIEAAIKGKLPHLVTQEQIKGDLHLHSNFPIEPSHDLGENSIEEFIQNAIKLGYHYIAFSEHNPSYSLHTETQILNLLRRKKKIIEQYNYSRVKNLSIRIFNSLEIDIKPDGKLAIPEKALDILDFGIVSVHSVFKMKKELMTKRILKALEHPKVKILGHPTGRKLNEREGYELEWEKIFDFCKKNNKFLEISAWPDRLDLPDFLVKEAVSKGVRLIINTDSHSVGDMEYMKYGVSVARRGWAQPKDILNTLPLKEFEKIILK